MPAFVPGGEFGVGVEDELMLVDDAGDLLGERAVPLVAHLQQSYAGPGFVVGEVYADQVEVTSPVCRGGDDVLASLTALRSSLVSGGARILSAGVLALRPHRRRVRRTPAHPVLAASEAEDHTYVWWDLRPRPLIGTLEVRAMDAVPSVLLAAGLAALVQGIARRAVERPDVHDLSDDVLAVNDERATRHGLDARVVDVDQQHRPLREVAARVVAEARDVLRPDGLDGPLDAVDEALAGESEPDRQRRVVATHGMPALLAELATRTSDLSAGQVRSPGAE